VLHAVVPPAVHIAPLSSVVLPPVPPVDVPEVPPEPDPPAPLEPLDPVALGDPPVPVSVLSTVQPTPRTTITADAIAQLVLFFMILSPPQRVIFPSTSPSGGVHATRSAGSPTPWMAWGPGSISRLVRTSQIAGRPIS